MECTHTHYHYYYRDETNYQYVVSSPRKAKTNCGSAKAKRDAFNSINTISQKQKALALKEARVVCRMLGFDGALEAPRSARFGQGSGDILRVRCYGTESSLADCFDMRVVPNCKHEQDAGALCYSGGISHFILKWTMVIVNRILFAEPNVSIIFLINFLLFFSQFLYSILKFNEICKPNYN